MMMDDFFLCVDDIFLKKEREKARKLRNTQWWKRKRSSGICHYCSKTFSPSELTMDHIIPLIRGGRSEKYNLVPCCKSCNTEKHQLLPCEWDAYMEKHRP